ncbi:MAG: asparagine synthase (glutamine-hydrolyzing) [Sulfuricella denitrificans]|nr:asparagine synthase (glutamine-hydrolyzing) [Sulfuricella denitrificans]
MCGIAGLLEFHARSHRDELERTVRSMATLLAHRGPDGEGVWSDADCGIALGHRRLSIIDLSGAGAQPMHSACGRYVLVCNGEIYNFSTLRKELELEGQVPVWRGHSDTEVMLAAISCWGVEAALERFSGMFAFALWDREKRSLSLARDRMGEKPVYYGWLGSAFIFGSELKALRAHPAWHGAIDRDSVARLLNYGYIASPHSIFRGIHKLQPGTLLEVRGEVKSSPRPYWTLKQAVQAGANFPFAGDDAAAADQLERLLRDTVRQQMNADVPLGAFLSGGVDSSLVTALMQAESAMPVKTFTIGFSESQYDEAEHARKVAQFLGTDHSELYLSPQQVQAVIPGLPEIYDEPFADPAQIPACLLAQMAQQQVRVALSGDGGDELFGGYDRYLWGERIWAFARHLPAVLKSPAGALLQAVPGRAWDSLGKALSPHQRYFMSSARMQKLARILPAASEEQIYLKLISHWDDASQVVIGAGDACLPMPVDGLPPWMVERMMYMDGMTYLPDDVMTKVDRATMSSGLESRAPFLDHGVAGFAWTLPLSMKIRHGRNKWLLRQVLYRHVPEGLVERPKMSLAVPLDSWLRGPLQAWAESLLDAQRLKDEGFFLPGPVRQKWLEHLSGRHDWQHALWPVLMFQAWLEKWGGR